MFKQKKLNVITGIFLAVFILALVNVNVFALIYGNETEGGYGDGGKSAESASIRELVIKGAGYFLESYAETLSFLKKIELSELEGIDYPQLQKAVTGAVDNMQQAYRVYLELKQLSGVTPYNTEVIGQLMLFDYAAFQQEKALNPTVFAEVEAYLSKGDIRGVYGRFLAISEELLVLLNAVKSAVDSNRFPTGAELWSLNQASAQSLLFGQYTSEVFSRVLNSGELNNVGI
ncbi:MAG: hypothetical protein GY950_01655 [bacterium]|nr:hypothetical protein [bacterium]